MKVLSISDKIVSIYQTYYSKRLNIEDCFRNQAIKIEDARRLCSERSEVYNEYKRIQSKIEEINNRGGEYKHQILKILESSETKVCYDDNL